MSAAAGSARTMQGKKHGAKWRMAFIVLRLTLLFFLTAPQRRALYIYIYNFHIHIYIYIYIYISLLI